MDDGGDTLYLYAPNGADYDLIDTANNNGGAWPAGIAAGYGSMERYGAYTDSDFVWVTNKIADPANSTDFRSNPIYGTPKAKNWAETITPITTTTITSDDPDPSVPGLAVNVTVSVTGGPFVPAGKVTIVGGNQICTLTLNNGMGNCNLNFATVGAKTLTATYTHTSNHTDSSATETHEVIQGIQTTTTITTISPDPAVVDSNIKITVKVDPSSGSTKPNGKVEITGADTNCNITLANGVGNCNIRFNSIGAKTITAQFNGDGVFIPSKDTTTTDVYLASTTTITNDTPDPSKVNQAVAVTVTVSGNAANPTGEVEITGASTNCTITLNDNGIGSCNVNFTTSGTKTLRASYSGDSLYAVSSDTESHSVSFSTTGSTTTGSGSSTVPPPPILGISEFLPRPGYDWNNDGVVDVRDEFIEIINAGRVDVNLNAYRLDDEANLGSSPYTLPNLTLKPDERAVFYGSETGILLSDAGDSVRLLKGSTVIDAYTYGVVAYPDQSWCRVPDRLGYWNHPCFPTPNNPNALTGTTPLPSGGPTGYRPPVCLLPDTTPKVFVYAECEAGGGGIWNRQFWDDADASEQLKLDEAQKWETVFK